MAKNLADSGTLFSSSDTIVPNSLGGLPRGCYPSEFSILYLLYWIFSPLLAYNINIIIIHLVAFFGMYILSGRYFFRNMPKQYPAIIALLFSLLPFWPAGGLAIAGHPLLLYAFLNIYYRDLNWKNWLIIAFIPFYSLLVLSNLFFIITISAVFALLVIIKRKINFYFIMALVLFTVTSILVEHRLFEMQFIQKFESHRSDIISYGTLNLNGVIGVSIMHFLKGQYHFHSCQSPFIILIAVIAFFVCRNRKARFFLLLSFIFAYVISLLLVLPDWIPLNNFMEKQGLVKSLNLRFYSLFPIIWFVILCYATKLILQKEKPILNTLLVLMLVLNGAFLMLSLNDKDYFNSEEAENGFYRTFFDRKNTSYATFDEYYQEGVFEKIRKDIPPGNFYIGCLGIDPEVAQFNNYYTVDGYFVYYPKAYNELMTSISKKEMQKAGLKNIGSRCVLISDDFEKKPEITELLWDFEKLKLLHTRYIFSNKRIRVTNLIDEKVYNDSKTTIFVYSLQ